MSITSDEPISFCCAVCGKPVSAPLVPLPDVGGSKGHSCLGCGHTVCSQHFSKSRNRCVRCTAGRDDWCSTPKLPEVPKLPEPKLPKIPQPKLPRLPKLPPL